MGLSGEILAQDSARAEKVKITYQHDSVVVANPTFVRRPPIFRGSLVVHFCILSRRLQIRSAFRANVELMRVQLCTFIRLESSYNSMRPVHVFIDNAVKMN